MTHIPIMVKVVDEVVPSASVDVEINEMGKVTSCYNCGGIYFYHVVTLVEKTEHATDTMIYCAQCGRSQGGYFHDPFNEMPELQSSTPTAKKEEEN